VVTEAYEPVRPAPNERTPRDRGADPPHLGDIIEEDPPDFPLSPQPTNFQYGPAALSYDIQAISLDANTRNYPSNKGIVH
jgi:hypothetical protein